MKKIFVLILLEITVIFPIKSMEERQVITLKERPTAVQNAIDQTFNEILHCKAWPHNGKKKYNLFGINDEFLLRHIADHPGSSCIFSHNHSQSEQNCIFIIDVGCADGSWGKNAMEFLLSYAPGKGKKFFILSLTGGQECESIIEVKDNVALYQFNKFKIENIDEELRKYKLNLIGKVDLIISSVTLRHLIDPIGTLKRMYSLLTPYNGILIADHFCLKLDNIDSFLLFPENCKEIFANTTHLFYLNLFDFNFILMRNNLKELNIPLEYSGEVFTVFKDSKLAEFKRIKPLSDGTKEYTEQVISPNQKIFFNQSNPDSIILDELILKMYK